MDKPRQLSSLAVAAFLVVLTACPSMLPAPSYRTLAKRADSLGVACNQAAARFAAAPSGETRQELQGRLTELNEALIETSGYEQEARRANSTDLIDANRAFLETGRAWANCSLQYNAVLVVTGERDAARHNYEGLLARLAGPQFVAERRRIQAAMNELGPVPVLPP